MILMFLSKIILKSQGIRVFPEMSSYLFKIMYKQ